MSTEEKVEVSRQFINDLVNKLDEMCSSVRALERENAELQQTVKLHGEMLAGNNELHLEGDQIVQELSGRVSSLSGIYDEQFETLFKRVEKLEFHRDFQGGAQ